MVMYFSPFRNKVAHLMGFRAVESSSSRFQWLGFESRKHLPFCVMLESDSIVVTCHLYSSSMVVMLNMLFCLVLTFCTNLCSSFSQLDAC